MKTIVTGGAGFIGDVRQTFAAIDRSPPSWTTLLVPDSTTDRASTSTGIGQTWQPQKPRATPWNKSTQAIVLGDR
jgi:hypothetical protein